MIDRINEIIDHFKQLDEQLLDPETMADQNMVRDIARERHRLEPIVTKGKQYIEVLDQIEEDQMILGGNDDELKMLVKEELPELESQKTEIEEELKVLLLPRDPADDKNTIVEIRAGTGGDEAALFAAELYRMYARYAESSGWSTRIMTLNDTGLGGFKEVVFSMKGEGVYGQMKFESGVHRVQRVPKTETSGRLHTSAATVAVLPEAEEADVGVVESDLKIDTYRASGAGGQHVNKTESAIRITHPNRAGRHLPGRIFSTQESGRCHESITIQTAFYRAGTHCEGKSSRAEVISVYR